MIIMKFGGTSLSTGNQIVKVAELIQYYCVHNEVVVVVSAIHGITDELIAIYKLYETKKYKKVYQEITNLLVFHRSTLNDLNLAIKEKNKLNKLLANEFSILQDYLSKQKDYKNINKEYVISFGERISCYLLTAALTKIGSPAEAVIASHIIIVDGTSSNTKVLFSKTKVNARNIIIPLLKSNIIPVITGYFAATTAGDVVTLGRGGSDYSATILARALNAKEVILWKDVNGIYDEDPKKNNLAKYYPNISYERALNLAHNGAKILHPATITPISSRAIPIRIKNINNPQAQGTIISKEEFHE